MAGALTNLNPSIALRQEPSPYEVDGIDINVARARRTITDPRRHPSQLATGAADPVYPETMFGPLATVRGVIEGLVNRDALQIVLSFGKFGSTSNKRAFSKSLFAQAGGVVEGGGKIAKNAKKMSPDDIGVFLNAGVNWHKGSAKKDFLKKFKKELRGDTNADFYFDETTKDVFLKSNKSGNWINTGLKFE